MSRAGRTHERGEEGFSLLELVAALTILAVGIVGVMGVTTSSMGVASTTSSRSKAVGLATQKIEEFRSKPYDLLAVMPSCPGPPPPTTTTTTPPTCYVKQAVSVGGREYVIESGVQMTGAPLTSTPASTLPNAYKEAYVIVSWTDRTYHEVRQQTIIYPGGRGPYTPTAPASGPSGGSPSAPTALVAVQSTIVDVVTVDLTWVPPVPATPEVVAYAIEYSTDNFTSAPYVITTTNPTTYLRVTDLAGGTTYQFRVYSVAANGNRSTLPSNTAQVTTVANVLIPCRVGVVSISPRSDHKAGNRLKNGNPVIAVNTTGNCVATTLRAEYSPSGTTTLQAALNRVGGVYTGLLDGNRDWDVGRHEIVILDGLNDQRASRYFLVCEPSKKVCR